MLGYRVADGLGWGWPMGIKIFFFFGNTLGWLSRMTRRIRRTGACFLFRRFGLG
jgi:hypothetical protein